MIEDRLLSTDTLPYHFSGGGLGNVLAAGNPAVSPAAVPTTQHEVRRETKNEECVGSALVARV